MSRSLVLADYYRQEAVRREPFSAKLCALDAQLAAWFEEAIAQDKEAGLKSDRSHLRVGARYATEKSRIILEHAQAEAPHLAALRAELKTLPLLAADTIRAAVQ